MNTLLIGNILMLIASILMVCVGLLKSNKRIVALQTVQMVIMTIGDFFLGSVPGAISSILAIVRNILCYNQKLGIVSKIVLIVILSISSLLFNNIGLLVLIPIFATAIFTWFIDTEDIVVMKVLIIATSLCWTIHDAYIHAYTILPFDIITIISTTVSLFTVQKLKLKPKTI